MNTKNFVSAAVVALGLMSAGVAADTLPKFGGDVLVDAQGRTLYTFDKDATGRSNCSGACAAAWPPAAVAADIERASGEITIITRDDGTLQWAHKGRPLYRFAGDAKAGDRNGDRQGSVWHVIRTGGTAQSAPAVAPKGYSY